jgi:hypothetical protein
LPALYSANVPEDFGIAIYLARANVDVWGIDQAWTLIPQDDDDYSYMEHWGMQYQVDALRSALAVAREVRDLMGGSGDRFNLLGYSSGGMTGYALLNHETQLPKKERHVQGFISGDINYDSLDAALAAFSCNDLQIYGAALEAGEYGSNTGFRTVGNLARTAPDDPSPIFDGFTNMQVALFLGTTSLVEGATYHYLAGVFNESGLPIGMKYISTQEWVDFMASGFDWEPTRFFFDYSTVVCDMYDSPFDDHLSEVTVPVLNWGAVGGIAPYGTATLQLLGSKDLSEHITSTLPPEDILVDFGHIDLFAGNIAPDVAWPPLLNWIRKHR